MDAELRAEIGREMDRIEALIHDLLSKNERLREALVKISERKNLGGERWKSDAERMRDIAKEALK